MSQPEGIDVDPAAERVTWREGGEPRCAQVPGVFDARYDAGSDRLLVLTRNGGIGAVVLLSRQGERLATVEAPEGYIIAHFADAAGPTIVCQGQEQDGHWWDWHFAIDPESGALRRTGPAY